MDDFQKYSLLISAISAVGTFVVAFIAIFGNWIKKQFIKPVIDITIENLNPFIETITENRPTESSEITYKKIHVKVNNKGKESALNSQILIEKIFKKREENQTFFLYQSLIPSHFFWENDNKSKPVSTSISHFIEIIRLQIFSEYSQNEDSVAIRKTSDEYRLWLTIQNSTLKGTFYFLGKGTFILPLIFYSDNLSNPQKICIEIFWNCDKLENMNDSNFYVKLLKLNNLPTEIKNEI